MGIVEGFTLEVRNRDRKGEQLDQIRLGGDENCLRSATPTAFHGARISEPRNSEVRLRTHEKQTCPSATCMDTMTAISTTHVCLDEAGCSHRAIRSKRPGRMHLAYVTIVSRDVHLRGTIFVSTLRPEGTESSN